MKRFSCPARVFLFLLFFLIPAFLFAQTSVFGIIEYLDDPFEAVVITPDGAEEEPFIGFELEAGSVIQTWETTAEIKLAGSGSILRVAEHSIFRLEGEESSGDTRVSAFSILGGKVRCVAARAAGQGYAVHTQSAVMGVRGTDFVVAALPDEQSLSVLDGAVETLYRGSGRSVLVEAGFAQNLADESAEPEVFDEDVRDLLVRMNSFKVLDPARVIHREDSPGAFDLADAATQVSPADLGSLKESRPATREPKASGEPGKDDSAEPDAPDRADRKARRQKDDGEYSFVLAAAVHPSLVNIAESTWNDLLRMGFGGAVSLTAGSADTPGFYGGFSGGVYSLGGKTVSSLEGSLWVPLGLTAGVRNTFSPPLSFYAAGEGGMQFTRMTYSIAGFDPIEGWTPYVLARLGLRYDLSPVVLEAGAAFGTVFDAQVLPFVRAVLGVVYEVRL